eukprot:1157331-Pelagomonas_calceolata.AAC.5
MFETSSVALTDNFVELANKVGTSSESGNSSKLGIKEKNLAEAVRRGAAGRAAVMTHEVWKGLGQGQGQGS